MLGPLRLERAYYHCAACGHGSCPWDEELGVTEARLRPGAAEVIKQALTTVPTKTVLTWCREKLGKTVQATRRALFVPLRKAEQKQDQLLLAA